MNEKNQENLKMQIAKGEPARGLFQAVGQKLYLAIPPIDDKPIVKTLIHEIGHFKWQGIGQKKVHDPLFYKILGDVIEKLGFDVSPSQDLNVDTDVDPDGTAIKSMPEPYGTTNPLLYYQKGKSGDAGDHIDIPGVGPRGWKMAQADAQHINFYKYDSSNELLYKENYYIASKGINTFKWTDVKTGKSELSTYNVNKNLPYETSTKYFNSDQKLERQESVKVDGSYDINTYDPLDKSTISSKSAHYDASDRLVSSVTQYDTNSRTYVINDVSDKYDWASSTDYYDKDGHKWQKIVVSDDGTKKTELFNTVSTRGYTEPNDPTKISYYDKTGTLIRYTDISYGELYMTNKKVLTSTTTYDKDNKYGWSSVTHYYNNKGQLVDVYTDNDTGIGFHGVQATFFTSQWDFASSVDSNAAFKDFNPYTYYAASNSSDLGMPDLKSYDPIKHYAYDYTGYKGLDFGGMANTDPYNNISLISDDPYDYIDFNRASQNFGPVVLDLDGDGVNLTALGHSDVRFAISSPDTHDQFSWAGPTDGLLVIDLADTQTGNVDGTINNIKEISFASLAGWSANKFDSDLDAAASMFDNNSDGSLDGDDSAFGKLKVWRDANGNGKSEAGELLGLTELGIVSINLNAQKYEVSLADGTIIHGLSTYKTSDGNTHVLADVAFSYDAVGELPGTAISGFTINPAEGGVLDIVNHRTDGLMT